MPVCRVWKIWILEKTNEFLIHYKTHNIKVDARKFHEANYSQKAEQQAKTFKKGGKKQAPASNVPKWSNPDYVNELDPKIVDMLVEFHKSQCTLGTPEAQAEIAQKREEIEQRRAELEDKNKSFWTAWTNRVSQVLCLQITWAIN